MKSDILAPGARIVVRDAQWLVQKIERTNTDGYLVHCIGLSCIVRDKNMQFFTKAEKSIKVLDPSKTRLVQDDSSSFSRSLLYVESLLQKTIPQDEKLYCGYKAAMDPLPFQLEPTAASLAQPRQRILIADAVGLGKTLECGILLSELIRRGHGRRILVVTVKSILTQFQKELWSRFTIPLTRLDSEGIRRIRERLPENYNPFYYYDKSIISIDTLKNATYQEKLQSTWWDVIVIDEAHNVAQRKNSGSNRAKVAAQLAKRCDSLILMSATPHDGSARSFASLMNMLDPTAIVDNDHYGPEDIKGLFIRRFKKDVKAQLSTSMERKVFNLQSSASEAEEEVCTVLTEAKFPRGDSKRGASHLFRILLEKSFFSSPDACLETVTHSLKKLRSLPLEEQENARTDIASLERLQSALEKVNHASFSKYARLLKELKDPNSPFAFTGKADDRIVIFTERIATLTYLEKHLPSDLGLKSKQYAVLKGTDTDTKQQEVVEDFGREHSELRLLLASDVASEGINLHYYSHKMLHFDIPWSLMLFQQRNGRIDRYGQKKQPAIGYLETISSNETIRGDQRILEVLIEKDTQAQDNIGDPSEFLGCYDQKEQEEQVALAMAQSTAEEFSKDMDAHVAEKSDYETANEGETDIFALLNDFVPKNETDRSETMGRREVQKASMPSLFANCYDFVVRGLDFLKMKYQVYGQKDGITIPLDENLPHIRELKWRFNRMQREMKGTEDAGRKVLKLSSKIEIVEQAISLARRAENSWPAVQYLWELHPFVQWLADTVTSGFRRDEAPLMLISGLEKDLVIYVIYALCPNRKGNPVYAEWFGIQVKKGDVLPETLTLDEIFGKRLGILGGSKTLPNSATPIDVQPFQAYLPAVCDVAINKMKNMAKERAESLNKDLQIQFDRLKSLQQKHREQAEHIEGTDPRSLDKKETLLRQTNKLFADYERWITETLEVEADTPSLRVAAVLVGS